MNLDLETFNKLPKLIQSLLDPSSYSGCSLKPASSCRLMQTHISWVVLTGSNALKIKKDLNFGFLDFSTLEKRKFFCEQEVILNSRTAPDYYLGVAPILFKGGSFFLGDIKRPFSTNKNILEDQDIVEWCVVMKEFDQSWIVENRIAAGNITTEDFAALGRCISHFHEKQCGTDDAISAFGAPSEVRKAFDQNYEQTVKYVPNLLSRKLLEDTRSATDAFFEHSSDLLEERVREGKIKRCHGDLHLHNILIEPSGRVVLFDCIEFNDAFACVDPMYDIAYIIVGLTALDQHGYCNAFFSSYLEWSNDYRGLSVLPLYLSRQAYVKAKIDSLSWADANFPPIERESKAADAKKHYILARRFCAPSRGQAIVMSGVSGSGKSTVGRLLAINIARQRCAGCDSDSFCSLLPVASIRSDCVRKHLGGIQLDQKGPSSLYTQEMSDQTYAATAQLGLRAVSAGWTVIFDAKFHLRRFRALVISKCAEMKAPVILVHVSAPRHILIERVNNRKADVSDATPALIDSQIAEFESFTEQETSLLLRVDTSLPIEPENLTSELKRRFALQAVCVC